MNAAGGWHSIAYSLKKAREVGGVRRLIAALRSRNACKTCALGMGGQQGGMVNEAGQFPEVCKKSIQAMAADMQGRVPTDFFDKFDFDSLARWTPRQLENAGRLTVPYFAGASDRTYRAITWEEAIDRVSGAMRETPPDETFFYFSGRSSNEAGFLLQLVARLYGTNNVNNCSFFCHQASGVGLSSVTGSGTATVVLDDLDACDLVVLIGGNPASNHPRFMRSLMEVRRRGGKVVVINPMKELGLVRFKVPSDVRSLLFGSRIADEYLQPHIGGDIALLTALAKSLHEAGDADEAFLTRHCEGWPEWRARLESVSWDDLASCGVDLGDIRRVARLLAASRRTIFCWTMGITHHEHGVQNVRAIANLALLRGMVGKPGAGLLPLRGHSNVQGIGSIGAVPRLKERVLEAMESRFGVTLPTAPGLDTLACVQHADEERMQFAWCLGGNLYASCPDSAFARAALSKIGMTMFMSTTLNTGHILGRGRESIVLPVLARDEEAESTTQESMFNFVRLSDGGTQRLNGPRAEVQVIADIARAVLGDDTPLDFASLSGHAQLREAIAAVIPGYEAIARIDATRQEFHVTGRTLHHPTFPTPSGKARIHTVDLPANPTPVGEDQLRLMTVRSEGQFNTVVYEEEDVYRGQVRRDVILMHASDMERLGIQPDELVTVSSETGQMTGLRARPFDIRAGNAAMYYPEANVLVPRRVDAASRTPSFKNVLVRITRQTSLPVVSS